MVISLLSVLASIIVAAGVCYYQIQKNRQLALLNETIKRMETMALIAINSLKDPQSSYEVYFLHRQIAKASLVEFLDTRHCCHWHLGLAHDSQEKEGILKQYEKWVEYCELCTSIESRHEDGRQQSSEIATNIYVQLAQIIQKLIVTK